MKRTVWFHPQNFQHTAEEPSHIVHVLHTLASVAATKPYHAVKFVTLTKDFLAVECVQPMMQKRVRSTCTN